MRPIFQELAAGRETLPLGEQLSHVLEAARQAVGVDRLHLWALSPEGDRLVYVTGSGVSKQDWRSLGQRVELRVVEAGAMGSAIRDKMAFIVDEPERRLESQHSATKGLCAESFVAVPILARGRTLGLLVADNKYSRAPLVPEALHLLPTFALHLATAVNEASLFAELESRESDLAEALEQQTATSEILRVISQSQRDVQPVFEAIAANALKLCEAAFAVGLQVRRRADPSAPLTAIVPKRSKRSIESSRCRRAAAGRAPGPSCTSSRLHPRCTREDAEYRLQAMAQTAGFRSAAGRAHAPRRQPDRSDQCRRRRASDVLRAPDRHAPDLRRPGGDRDREHAAVQ